LGTGACFFNLRKKKKNIRGVPRVRRGGKGEKKEKEKVLVPILVWEGKGRSGGKEFSIDRAGCEEAPSTPKGRKRGEKREHSQTVFSSGLLI